MPFSQFIRIETIAGGTMATNREFIKAAHSRLSKAGKSARSRKWRHAWLRAGLAHKAKAETLHSAIMG